MGNFKIILLCFFWAKRNSNFLIPISVTWCCKPLIFKTLSFLYNRIHGLKYQRTSVGNILGLENNGLLWQKLRFFFALIVSSLHLGLIGSAYFTFDDKKTTQKMPRNWKRNLGVCLTIRTEILFKKCKLQEVFFFVESLCLCL